MSCEDVEPLFSDYLSGQIALTERFLVETHLQQCSSCRPERARRQEMSGRRAAAWSRTALASLVGPGCSLLATEATGLASRFIARLMQTVAFVTDNAAALVTRVRSGQTVAPELLAHATMRGPRGPRPPISPPAPARREMRAPRPEPAPPETRPRAAAVQPGPLTSAPVAAVNRAGSPAPAPAPAPARAPAPAPTPSTPHVVGRLSTKDRSGAEGALAALLSGVRGTEIDRSQHARFTSFEVIVPHSGYREFTHGLGRIGFWRLEATTFSLPDVVHVSIRVSE